MASDIQVPDIQCVVLNELPAWLHFVTHQSNEHFLGLNGIGEFDSQQLALGWIHRGLKQFLGVHFSQTLEAIHLNALLANRLDPFENLGDREQRGDRGLLTLARKAGDLQVGAWEACYDSVKEELLREIHPSRQDLFRAFAPPTGHPPARELSSQLAPALADAARRATPHSEPGPFLDRISVPVRLVHGRGDRLIPFSETLRLAEAFPKTADIRVYLTGLFSHSQMDTTAGAGGGVEEQLHFLRMLSDLLMLV